MKLSSGTRLRLSRIRSVCKNENGAVLVIGLMFIAILAMLGTTAVVMTTTDMQIGANYKTNAQAFYIAEAGLARAEVELKNDLAADDDLANSSFEAISGTITISPSSASFYTVFDTVSFGDGSYTIEFKNYDDGAGGFDPTTILVRSTGRVSAASVTQEGYLSAENVSPWNNAIFADGGGGAAPITGNIDIAGSVHLLGTGLPSTTTVFNNQTGDCLNSNTGMDSTLANKIDGGTSSDLNARFRVKNGRMDMSIGSGNIGTSASAFRGIYVTSGTDGGAGVNSDIIGGDNSGAGQNLYADKGASSPTAYDLEDSVPMPTIDVSWMNANSLDLTSVTEQTATNIGLVAGNLELTGKYKVGPTWYYPDINQTDGTNSISFNSSTGLLTINGIIKVLSLNISDDITYSGAGTIYVTGTTVINGHVLPTTNASYPTTNVIGVVSTGNMTLPSDANKLLTGAYYSAGTITSSKQTELAGTIVCKNFNITAQVPKFWQVPSLADNLPPGMPGEDPAWVFTDRTWKDLSLE